MEWIFDPAPPSQARRGGSANVEIFPKEIDGLVREVLQNARDQRRSGQERVRVKFTLEELRGSELEEFLTNIAWRNLREHVDAAIARDYVTVSPRLKETLDRVEGEGFIRVLRIEDRGTNGLTGDEDDHDSNFNLLCRHELMTPGERRQSGGSFGLGKSVLWLFSGLSTVLFSSGIEEEGTVRQRFFGRSILPFHETHRAWEGSGWFGAPDEILGQRRAVSVFDEEAVRLAEGCRLARPGDDAGTSILVVGFDEPALEQERPVEDVCQAIADSSARWFWPALTQRQLEIAVEGICNSRLEYSGHVHPTAEVTPFVLAQTETGSVSELAQEPGEVAERTIEVTLPPQRRIPGRIEDPRGPVTAEVLLRVRIAESGETEWADTVALQRGTGMVVEYTEPARRRLGDQPFHGVLLAGLARGSTPADEALEEFLRAAEPPKHDEWTHTTERIKAEYRAGAGAPGARAALQRLKTDIARVISELTREDTGESTEGPEALRRLFPLPGVGGAPPPTEPFRLVDPRAELSDATWVFGGTFVRHQPGDDDWRFRVALSLDQETGGGASRSEKLPIEHLVAVDAREQMPRPDGSIEILVPAGVDQVDFEGTTGASRDLPPGGLRRVRVTMDVRPVSAEGTRR